MYEHLVTVNDRRIEITKGRRFVEDNSNADTLTAMFDPCWDECEIAVVFSNGDTSIRTAYSAGMSVPWEALQENGLLYLTFVGTKAGNVVIETAEMTRPFVVDRSGIQDGADPAPPTPTEYQAFTAELSGIRADIEAGLLKGDKGDDGDDGKDADIAGAEAAKEAANAAAARANTEADKAHDATIEAAAAAYHAGLAKDSALYEADRAYEAAQSAREVETYATAAASNANRTAAEIKQRADSGEFDGKPGYTPVKGVDYFDGDPGRAPVITASKDGTTTTIYSDGEAIAEIEDGVAPEITAAIISNALGFVPQKDTRINGESIVVDGVADIPKASNSELGVIALDTYSYGLTNAGRLYIVNTRDGDINTRASNIPLTAAKLDYAVKAAMTDGKGAAWSEDERHNARKRIGLGGDFELIEEITLTEATSAIMRDKAPNGDLYDLRRIVFKLEIPASSSVSTPIFYINGNAASYETVMSVYQMIKTSRSFATVDISFNDGLLYCTFINTVDLPNSGAIQSTPRCYPAYVSSQSVRKISITSGQYPFPEGTVIRIYGAWA